ncbi:FHA domain-containing protein [Arthrobacter sp. Br18]|uniref:FHA domain-containing protein n=1 Tax=Arthrobacter sp. Br18 TaxID=1312954 RepID=UPI00047A30E7|nr:FHA domain-containing protein [Arthrobacter sp. Br18]
MNSPIHLDIDLVFSLVEPPQGGDPAEHLSGTVTAAGTTIEVFVDNPGAFGGSDMPSLAGIRSLAKALAGQGLAVSVAGPKGNLVSLGAVKSSRAQRLLTRSPHIRLGSPSTLAPLLRVGRRALESSGSKVGMPPSTPFPLVPTANRRIKRTITTTHNAPGSGRPRLIFVEDSATWEGQVPREFELSQDRSSIGSAPGSSLQLGGLQDLHAEIVHTADDEYVLIPHGPVGGSVNARGESILRTGARVQLGPWRLAFFREEYADHGRPFGGRSGGELAYQRPQRNPRTGATEQDGSAGIGDFRRPPR